MECSIIEVYHDAFPGILKLSVVQHKLVSVVERCLSSGGFYTVSFSLL